MNRILRLQPEHAARQDAPGDDSRGRGVPALSDSLDVVFATIAGNAPLRELARQGTASVDLLYCGGVLHRLSRVDGAGFVTGCFRVLKPLGSVRIATIDLDQFVQGYLFDWTDEREADASRTQKLNDVFLQPGVQFIYGEEELTGLLARAGFADIRRFAAGASSNRRFWNLESDHACALVLEAIKP
jgi:predicted SAM-dependent methyltransferase